MARIRLKCRISKGMFTDEYVVSIESENGQVSFYVPKEFVDGEPDQEGRIVVQSFEEGGTQWVIIPDAQRTIVSVPQDNLVAA